MADNDQQHPGQTHHRQLHHAACTCSLLQSPAVSGISLEQPAGSQPPHLVTSAAAASAEMGRIG